MGQNPTYLYISAYLLQCFFVLLVFPTSKSEIISSCSHQPSSEALFDHPVISQIEDWTRSVVQLGESPTTTEIFVFFANVVTRCCWYKIHNRILYSCKYVCCIYIYTYIYIYHLLLSIIFYCLPGAKNGSIKLMEILGFREINERFQRSQTVEVVGFEILWCFLKGMHTP